MSNRPILSITYKRGETTYSVLSVWPGRFPGTYSISRDKGSDKYPAISLVEVIKGFAAGDGFVNVRMAESGGGRQEQSSGGGGAQDYRDFDDDVPF